MVDEELLIKALMLPKDKDYVKNPASVDQSWHSFFNELAPEELAILSDYEKLDWSKHV